MSVLLVPFALEAMIANKTNHKEKFIAAVSPNYTGLEDTHIGEKLDPGPNGRDTPLPAGVHLHFILPDALTHGKQNENGMEYPAIPNRWLVTRLVADNEIYTKCWIVESDYVGTDNVSSITIPDLADKDMPYKYLGRSYLVTTPPSSDGVYLDKLTAVGAGDPTFAAYYPSCRSVLGFHDPLTDIADGNLTYFVIGYYSNNDHNPLYGVGEKDWQQRLANLKWSVPDGTAHTTESIYHGLVYEVAWKGDQADYPSGKPEGEICACMGASSVEALSALITNRLSKKHQAVNLERFLNALQYDLIDELEGVDGVADIEDICHANGFNRTTGGQTWIVRAEGKKDEKQTIPKQTDLPLLQLNQAQEKLEKAMRQYCSWQDSLYYTWYTYMLMYEDETPFSPKKPTKEEIRTELDTISHKLDQLKVDIVGLTTALQRAKDDLCNILEGFDGFIVEHVSKGEFFQPKDPVILLGGNGIRREFAYGEDGRFCSDNTLACRTSTVIGLEGSSPNGQSITLSQQDVLSYCPAFSNMPNAFTDLLCEVVCLSPDLAALVAEKEGMKEYNTIGTLPSPIGLNKWEQPWITLFMEWHVFYYPTKNQCAPDNSMDGWEFKDIDYVYNEEIENHPCSYHGRTVLTPHSTYLLRDIIKKYSEKYKETDAEMYEYMTKAAELVKNLAVLSQSLGGFNQQLVCMHQTYQLPPMGWGDDDEMAQHVSRYLNDKELLSIVPTATFLPVRSGFIKIAEINAVNSFGQVQQLTSQLTDTLFSENMTPERNMGNYGMLPPKVTQPGRVRFQWISVQDGTPSGCGDERTPICGYIIPNLLNRELMIFERDGNFIGMIKLFYRDKKTMAQWVTALHLPQTDFEQTVFSNTYLRDFVRSILDCNSKEDQALNALLQIIDQRLSTIFAAGKEFSQDISVLWGRPLALARGEVSIEFEGRPSYSMAYEDFAKYDTHDFEKIQFPLMFGDVSRVHDGTVGYFMDDNFGSFYPAYGMSPVQAESLYVNYKDTLKISACDDTKARITLLLEPETKTNIRSGILPVLQIGLPCEYVKNALEQLYMAFEINPVVSEKNDICIPLIKEADAQWSWMYRKPDGSIENRDIMSPEAVFHEQKLTLIDGYLMRRKDLDDVRA